MNSRRELAVKKEFSGNVCGGGGKGGEHQVNTIKICYTHVKLSTNFKSTNGNTKRAIKYANLEFAPRI